MALQLRHDAGEFAALTERLWNEVRPLYEQIHCFARAGLNRHYGDAVQPATGPIRADLLGNLWAQEWGNIYDVVAPRAPRPAAPYDLTQLLERRQLHAGADRPHRARPSSPRWASRRCRQTFWERSMITQPRDREVICHASAWDVDNVRGSADQDVHPGQCATISSPSITSSATIIYQRAYNRQPFLYLNSANDGFHEAIGDTIALSVTPEYLVQIGLLQQNQLPNDGAGPGAAAPPGARQDRLPALRPADRPLSLGHLLRPDRARTAIRRRGTRCGCNIRASSRRAARTEQNFDAGAQISRRRRACPTRAISSPGSCSSNSTRRPATLPAGAGRCTAAPSTAIARSAGG